MSAAPVRRLWAFWTEPIDPAPLALFRILLGLTVFLSALTGVGARLALDLGADGLVPAAALGSWPRDTGRFCLLVGPGGVPLLEDCFPPDGAVARTWAELGERLWFNAVLFAVWMAAVLGMTVGLWTRTTTVAAWALACSFQTRLWPMNNGGDALYRIGLFYLIFSRAGAAWSADAWLRRRRGLPTPERVPPWPMRLLQIQLVLVYLFSGVAKVAGGYPEDAASVWDAVRRHDYWNGTAVYWLLNDATLNRVPYRLAPVPLAVCRLLSWATLVFELGFPWLVLWRRTRPWLLLGGLGFHLGILLATEVGWFSPVMMCWYALFVRPSTATGILQRLARW